MERDRHIADSRAGTDASLGAERASTDFAFDLTMQDAQRAQDDLIERDRLLADQGLLQFRDKADSLRAFQRFTSPGKGSGLTLEREAADEGTKAERMNADAVVDRERNRADSILDTERRANEVRLSQLQSRRQDTDEHLTVERTGVDIAVKELRDTRSALAVAQHTPSRAGDVLAMVTHDLRSPLAIIAMNAQLLAENTVDSAALQGAEEVLRAAARMERLLSDLLDVARIDSGTLDIRKAPHEVGVFLGEIYQSYRRLFEHRGVALFVDGPAAALTVSFDHDRIVQVMSNLLGNAMKFTPRGGTVHLGLARGDGEIEFSLQDSGRGIRADALPHVFERFSQINSGDRRGLGLGLHISQRIVEAHGGRIWGESEFGKGATFRFTLPVEVEQAKRDAPARPVAR
jgi:signal transduction histidine kinase